MCLSIWDGGVTDKKEFNISKWTSSKVQWDNLNLKGKVHGDKITFFKLLTRQTSEYTQLCAMVNLVYKRKLKSKKVRFFKRMKDHLLGSATVQDFKLEWLSLSFQPSTERTKRLAKLEEPVEPPSTKALEPIWMSLQAIAGILAAETMQVKGYLNQKPVSILIDSWNKNFEDPAAIEKVEINLQIYKTRAFTKATEMEDKASTKLKSREESHSPITEVWVSDGSKWYRRRWS